MLTGAVHACPAVCNLSDTGDEEVVPAMQAQVRKIIQISLDTKDESAARRRMRCQQ
jgi:hypothetical protein